MPFPQLFVIAGPNVRIHEALAREFRLYPPNTCHGVYSSSLSAVTIIVRAAPHWSPEPEYLVRRLDLPVATFVLVEETAQLPPEGASSIRISCTPRNISHLTSVPPFAGEYDQSSPSPTSASAAIMSRTVGNRRSGATSSALRTTLFILADTCNGKALRSGKLPAAMSSSSRSR